MLRASTSKMLGDRQIFRFFRKWAGNLTRIQRDAFVIAILTAPAFAFLINIDAFDLLHEFTRSHENWQLDEFISLSLVLALALGIFTWRRMADLRSEIIKRKAAEDHANTLARHDPLTGLPNRRHFVEAAIREIGHLPRDHECALLIVDLDFFKPVNDLYGHHVGDIVLCEIAERLKKATEAHAIVARLGGDEFGIVMSCPIDSGTPERLARRIVHDVCQPITVASRSIKLGVSVGATLTEGHRRKPDPEKAELSEHEFIHQLLRHADLAMYRAKTEGRGQYRFFENEMDEKLKLHFQLEAELSNAIASRQIIPYYQELVDLSSNEVTGYEVLARWRHPILGVISPDLFIPIAEDTGMISNLTISILEQAVEEAKNWPETTYLSLNLSPRQLANPWLAEEILAILTKSGFQPQRLEVEITESSLVEKIDEVKAVLASLRNVGVRIALDDFGTGYSGLYHLRELSIDTIKIDRSFITHMLANREEEKIVEAVINLSNAMGITTIAEGVETPEVRSRLLELGCKSGQGIYFGQPQDAKTTLETMKRTDVKTKNIA